MTDPQLQLGFDTPEFPASTEIEPLTPPKAEPILTTATTAALESVFPEDVEHMAQMLERHPDYRVLRRLVPHLHFDRRPQGPVIRVLVLDTETTGLDHTKDKIIELALLQVDVDTLTGLPVGDVLVYDELEDPGMPVSQEIQALTGISSEMVQGKRLDEARITAMLAGADLIIAHNAGFDRPFCEARMPAFAQCRWGCSFADIDWKKEGQSSAKLSYLALEKGWFYDAHRAEIDCHALLAVLAEPLPSFGLSGLAKIITMSHQPSYRLQANNAPFDAKDLLKSRAYRWNAEQKVWHTRLNEEAQLTEELKWLQSTVYGGRLARVQVEKMDAFVKYSMRTGELSTQQI